MKPLLLLGAYALIVSLILSELPRAWMIFAAANSGSNALPNAAATVQVPENLVQKILFVDNQSPNASDQNPGTENLPFNTVSQGVRAAQANNAKGIGTKVYIKPGVYREQIFLPQTSNQTSAPMVFEGTVRGSVILSGSDVWTGWQQIGANLYQHPWPYRWGEAPYPQGWAGNVTLDPIVRRREMIFVNGRSLTQVLSYANLTNYSFYIAEDTGTIYIELGPDLSLANDSVIEVALRPFVFRVQGQQNVVLRDLTFRHGNAAVQGPAVEIDSSSNVLIEGCSFLWNNWIGLGLTGLTNVALYNNAANSNGATGIDGYNLKNLVMGGNETSSNNWRGAAGSFYGWSVAGAKLGGVHTGSIRHHLAANNLARGLWLDYDNNNVTVDDSRFTSNYNDGIFIEATQGPTLVENSSSTGNSNGAGIAGANSSDITLLDDVVAGNGTAQVLVTGDLNRTVTDWESGVQQNLQATRWSIRSNTIGSQDSLQPALATPFWAPFFTTLLSAYNTWSKSGDSRAFQVDSMLLTFQQWQSLTHTDTTSIFTDGPVAGCIQCQPRVVPRESTSHRRVFYFPVMNRRPSERGADYSLPRATPEALRAAQSSPRSKNMSPSTSHTGGTTSGS